jgi:hypothetical protein
VLYAVVAGFLAWQAMWNARLAGNPFADLVPGVQITLNEALQIALIVCLPPLILLVMGWGALWAARGFRQ